MYTICYIATIAAGGGDLSFASRLLAYLERRQHNIILVIAAQSGTDVWEAYAGILSRLTDSHHVAAGKNIVAVRLAIREKHTEGVRKVTDFFTCEGLSQLLGTKRGHEFEVESPPLPMDVSDMPQVDAVIQGPLRLFSDSSAALRNLGLQHTSESEKALNTIPKFNAIKMVSLLTVREFGQARFCSSNASATYQLAGLHSDDSSTPPCFRTLITQAQRIVSRFGIDASCLEEPAHFDLSAGLADDELGVFTEGFTASQTRKTPQQVMHVTTESGEPDLLADKTHIKSLQGVEAVVEPPSSAEPGRSTFLSYTRTAAHTTHFGRAVGLILLDKLASNISSDRYSEADKVEGSMRSFEGRLYLTSASHLPHFLSGLRDVGAWGVNIAASEGLSPPVGVSGTNTAIVEGLGANIAAGDVGAWGVNIAASEGLSPPVGLAGTNTAIVEGLGAKIAAGEEVGARASAVDGFKLDEAAVGGHKEVQAMWDDHDKVTCDKGYGPPMDAHAVSRRNNAVTVILTCEPVYGRFCRLEVFYLDTLGLSSAEFQGVLTTCEIAQVTGDASLNEAIALGIPFLYSTEPHKLWLHTEWHRAFDSVAAKLQPEGGPSSAAMLLEYITGKLTLADPPCTNVQALLSILQATGALLNASKRLEESLDFALHHFVR